jgi:hypothetical protein
MGVNSVAFESAGQRTEHYIPGSYSRTNYVNGEGGGTSANRAVFIGESDGGKPNTLYFFYSPSDAIDKLRGGPLLEAVLCAFSPGGDLIPQYVGAMRVNPGTQASRTMLNSAIPVLSIKAKDYGLHTNQVKMKLIAGTTSGSKKVMLSFAGNEYSVDNIIRQSFTVQYVGTGSAATMTITKTGLTTTVTDVSADNLSVDFTSFDTIEDIVNYINDKSAYTCVAITANASSERSDELDSISAVDIKTAAYTANSNLQALIDTLENAPWIGSAEFITDATSRVLPDNDSDWIYFSGGTHGACTVTEYSDTLEKLETEEVSIIGTASTDEAVHVLIKNHCVLMSSTEGRKERMFLVGGATGETVDETIARAKALASDTGSVAYPGYRNYGVLTAEASSVKLYSPAMYAAKLIGQEVALAVNEPMTNKSVDVLAWEVDLKKSDLVKLIQGGVIAGGKSQDNRFATIRTVTTYQGNELQRCERSMKRESNYMARDLRDGVAQYVGKPGVTSSMGAVEATFWARVADWFRQGLIVKDDKGRTAWGLVIRRVGSATFIEFHTNLTAPQNFFFITANQHYYGSQESVAV